MISIALIWLSKEFAIEKKKPKELRLLASLAVDFLWDTIWCVAKVTIWKSEIWQILGSELRGAEK